MLKLQFIKGNTVVIIGAELTARSAGSVAQDQWRRAGEDQEMTRQTTRRAM